MPGKTDMMNDKKENFQEIIQGSKPVLVDFFAEWCGPCKMMAPVIDEFSKEAGGKVRVLKVDIDKNPKAASIYHVQSVPTFVLFKNGKVVWRQSGTVGKHLLNQLVQQHSN